MCAGKTTKNKETVTVVTASTMQYLTQHPNTHQRGKQCSESLSVVNSCRETPGPIPNPEAKPAHADGTATGRLWESKSPPTPNNKNTTKYKQRRGRYTTALFLLRFTSPPGRWRASSAKPRVRLKAMEGRVWADSHLVTGPQRGKGAPSCLCSLGRLSYFYYHHTAYPVAAIGFNIGHREAASTRLGVPGLCY